MSLTYNATYVRNTGNSKTSATVIIAAKNVGFTVNDVEADCLNAVKKFDAINPTQYEKQSLQCLPITEEAGSAYSGVASIDAVIRLTGAGMKKIMLQDLTVVVDDAEDFMAMIDSAITTLYKDVSTTLMYIEQITFKF